MFLKVGGLLKEDYIAFKKEYFKEDITRYLRDSTKYFVIYTPRILQRFEFKSVLYLVTETSECFGKAALADVNKLKVFTKYINFSYPEY